MKISPLEADSSKLHPKWEDDDYIERLKVDNHDSYKELTESFKEMCKGMSLDDLDKKLSEIDKAYEHVSNSLEAQRMTRKGNKISEAMKKTAYTKGLLSDQLEIGKSFKKKLLEKNNISYLEDND